MMEEIDTVFVAPSSRFSSAVSDTVMATVTL